MLEKNLEDEIRILHDEVKKKLASMLAGQVLASDLNNDVGSECLLVQGATLSEDVIATLSYSDLARAKIKTRTKTLIKELKAVEERTDQQVEVIRQLFEEKKEKIRRGDELPPGVIKMVKVLSLIHI